jgi:hypothetical protein
VDPTAYAVTADGATIKVTPQTVGSVADSALKDREVTVKGCIWLCKGQKRVTWAELK